MLLESPPPHPPVLLVFPALRRMSAVIEADGEQLVLLCVWLFELFWVAYSKASSKAIGTGEAPLTLCHIQIAPRSACKERLSKNGNTVWWLAEAHSKAALGKCVCVCGSQ